MKNYQNLILVALTILIFSCSNRKDFVPTFKGDMDGKGDWINSKTIGKFGGVTGSYCSRVDSINDYSYGLYKLVSEINPDPIKKAKVSVWVKLEDLSKKNILVISLKGKDGKSIFWSGHEVNPVIKEIGKWYKFDAEDVLPDYDMNGTTVEVYVYNPNKNVAYVDDFEIRFFEE